MEEQVTAEAVVAAETAEVQMEVAEEAAIAEERILLVEMEDQEEAIHTAQEARVATNRQAQMDMAMAAAEEEQDLMIDQTH